MANKSLSANLGFGCVGLASYQSLNHALKLLNLAYDNGIVYFDTAPVYSKGYSEIILGKFTQNKRDKILIATKFGLADVATPLLPAAMAIYLNQKLKPSENKPVSNALPTKITFRSVDKAEVEKSLMQSLKRLKTDYLDCFLLHEGLSSFLTDEAFSYLQYIKTAGIVKKIGLATNYFNLKDDQQIADWDILQYDHDPLGTEQQGFLSQYPDKTHIYHSTLKKIKNINPAGGDAKENAGIILASEIGKNPNGRILFATGNHHRLKQNLVSAEKHLTTDSQLLNELLSHAI